MLSMQIGTFETVRQGKWCSTGYQRFVLGGRLTASVESSSSLGLHNLDDETNVTVNLASSNTSEGTVTPATMTFTEANWETPQTVTVTGVDDNNSDGHQDYQITLSEEIIPWSGTQQLGTSSADVGQGVTSDSAGNIYVTGYTSGSLDGNNSAGNKDIFLVKYNSSGSKQWTKQLGSSSAEIGQGVTSDSAGNIYVTGYTSGSLDGNTSAGDKDIFLVKYNSSGSKQWTKQLGSSSTEIGQGVTSDSAGNIYVSGYTSGSLDGNTSAGNNDIFLVKYNSSGTKQWTKQLGSLHLMLGEE